MVGVELPLELMVRHIMVTSPVDHEATPLVLDPEFECYFGVEPNGSMLVCDMASDDHGVTDPDAVSTGAPGYEYYLAATESVQRLVPTILDLDAKSGWRGLQTHTPDGHAILGETDVDGFFVACGLSGHGVQQSPSVGAAMADLLCTGGTDVLDPADFGVSRFEGGTDIEPEEMA